MRLPQPFSLLLPLLSLAACQSAAEAPRQGSPSETARDWAAELAGVVVDDANPIARELARAEAEIAALIALPDDQRTFDNTVRAMDDIIARFFTDSRRTAFMESVSPDPAVRERGSTASKQVGEFFIEFETNEDLYRALNAYASTNPRLEGENARLLERLLRDFKRAGMELSAADREALVAIEKEMNDLGNEFKTNIREDDTTLRFTRDELRGIPSDFIDTLPVEEGTGLVVCKMQGPLISRLFRQCEVGGTRRRASIALGQRAPGNVPVLERMIELRHRKAQLLGYESLAHYQTETRMAKSPERVMAFYEDLRPKLREKALLDFQELLEAKRKHLGDATAELNAWDSSFYSSMLKRDKYAFDDEALRPYFSIEGVREGLFSITQHIYGIQYRDITEKARAEGRMMWHEDVELWEVLDSTSGEMLGEFYLDLHPRDGKYNHAAQFPLRFRKVWADGTVDKPLVALVCNFTKPTADKPALLAHSEVETFFHEFGHCLHSIFTEATHLNFAGTQVARDFVEAPSQMFENWVWDPAVLRTFARHYQTAEAFPEELIDGMIAAQHLSSGLNTEGQVFLGMMDMAFHMGASDGKVDTTQVREEVYRQTRLFPAIEGSHSQSAFGHLVGYEAGYYGYLWSLVFAQDMASKFRESGLLNPEEGMRFRKMVLAPGGTKDELDVVRDYLGREPRPDAFLEHLGL